MSDPYGPEWSEMDRLNIVGLALNRYLDVREYGREAPASMVFSNGTEHEMAQGNAILAMHLAPVLRDVVDAGIAELLGEPWFRDYVLAMASGSRDDILRIEAERRAAHEAAS